MTDAPDLTRYYLAHEAMRESARWFADALADLDLADLHRIRAVRRWYAGFAGELVAHHTLEDRFFFPALAERVPAFADELDRGLAAEHVQLDRIMGALAHALRGLTAGPAAEGHHLAARHRADELSRLLDHHLGIEDEDVLPLFARHFSAEEYAVLDDAVLKKMGLRQLLFTVPWGVAAADDETRTHVLAEAPVPIRVIWRLTRRRYLRRAALVGGTRTVELAR